MRTKWSKSLLRFVVILISVSLLISCGGGAGKKVTEQPPVKVGVLAPLTGNISAYGQDQVNAVNMAVEEINAAGGILGRKLTVQVEDDERKPELAASMTQKLINDGVDVIIGGMSSSSTMAGGPIANTAKVLMISPWSTNPLAAFGDDWVFRACFSDEFQGKIQANYMINELKCKKPAQLLDVGDDGSKGQGEVVQKTVAAAGIPMITVENYTGGDRDFKAQLTKIKSLNPDCLDTPNYYGEDALIRIQMKELGLNVPMIGGDGNDSGEFFTIAGEAANGFMMTTHYAPDDPRPVVQDFRAKFKSKFGMIPRSTAALSYDAVMLYKIAVEKAGSWDKQKIRDAMAGLKDITTLVTAPTFSMDPNGTGIKSLAIVEAKNGDWVWKATVNP